jgi:hypothetical protein
VRAQPYQYCIERFRSVTFPALAFRQTKADFNLARSSGIP